MEQYTNAAASTPTANPTAAKNTATATPKKLRRVGTFSFGVTLIAAGALLLLHIFMPALDLTLAIKLAPLILILLGIEVLVYAARPGITLKYDFVGMFLCFVLVCGVGCVVVAGEVMTYYGLTQTVQSTSGTAFSENAAIPAATAEAALTA